MAGKVQFVLSLLDDSSPKAAKVQKALEGIEKQMRALDRMSLTARMEKEKDPLKKQRMLAQLQKSQLIDQRSLVGSTESWLTKLSHGLSVAQAIGSAFVNAASAAGRLAFNIGRGAVAAAATKEAEMLGFRLLLGSESAAGRLMEQVEAFADRTPFQTQDVMRWSKGLLAKGFAASEIPQLLMAGGDVGALNGMNPELVDRLFMAFGQIKGKGRLQGEELMQLAEAGLATTSVYAQLERQLGTTRGGVLKLMQAGQVSSDQGIAAIVGAIQTDISKGRLGRPLEEFSRTVPGLLSTIESRWKQFQANLFRADGFGQFKGFLGNLAEALDPKSPSGQRLQASITKTFDDVFGSVFGDLGSSSGMSRVEAIIDGIGKAIRVAGASMKGFVRGIGEGLGGILGEDFFNGPLDEQKLARVSEAMQQLGKNIATIAAQTARFAGWLSNIFDGNTVLGKLFSFWNDDLRSGAKLLPGGGLLDLFDENSGVRRDMAGVFGSNSSSGPAIPTPTFVPSAFAVPGSGTQTLVFNQQIDARGATPDAAERVKSGAKAGTQGALGTAMPQLAASMGVI